MKVVYTTEALASFREALNLIRHKVSREKIREIRKKVFDKADKLKDAPEMGQKEEYMAHLGQGHRRVIEGHYKIIYLIQEELIIVTDIFDSRQDPEKMRG